MKQSNLSTYSVNEKNTQTELLHVVVNFLRFELQNKFSSVFNQAVPLTMSNAFTHPPSYTLKEKNVYTNV